MKKYFKIIPITVIALVALLITGCDKVKDVDKGDYKEGTYFGSVEFESYGKKYVTTSFIYVNENGLIKSVFLDSTYNKDDVNTTKKVLGDKYGMKDTSANIGVIEGGAEWYQQVAQIEKKVVEKQGLDWIKWSDDAKTKLNVDVISGVTITADTYIKAIENALLQAK